MGETEIYRRVLAGERLYQGEILEKVLEWTPKYGDSPDLVIGLEPRRHKLVVVVTQDCDLEQDWRTRTAEPKTDSGLPCVLLCPAWPAEELRAAQGLSNDLWKPARSNKNERFQYLSEVAKATDNLDVGHPAMLIDFKSTFTLRTIELYRQLRSIEADAPRRRFRLETPWAEQLQLRFACYQSRIALPRDHFIPENRR